MQFQAPEGAAETSDGDVGTAGPDGVEDCDIGWIGSGKMWTKGSPSECTSTFETLKTKNSSYLLSGSKVQPPSERSMGRQHTFTEAVVQLRGDVGATSSAAVAEFACAEDSGTVHVLSRFPSQLQSFNESNQYESTTVLDLEPLLGKLPCSGMLPIVFIMQAIIRKGRLLRSFDPSATEISVRLSIRLR